MKHSPSSQDCEVEHFVKHVPTPPTRTHSSHLSGSQQVSPHSSEPDGHSHDPANVPGLQTFGGVHASKHVPTPSTNAHSSQANWSQHRSPHFRRFRRQRHSRTWAGLTVQT